MAYNFLFLQQLCAILFEIKSAKYVSGFKRLACLPPGRLGPPANQNCLNHDLYDEMIDRIKESKLKIQISHLVEMTGGKIEVQLRALAFADIVTNKLLSRT
jgi:hypothetical protein